MVASDAPFLRHLLTDLAEIMWTFDDPLGRTFQPNLLHDDNVSIVM